MGPLPGLFEAMDWHVYLCGVQFLWKHVKLHSSVLGIAIFLFAIHYIKEKRIVPIYVAGFVGGNLPQFIVVDAPYIFWRRLQSTEYRWESMVE